MTRGYQDLAIVLSFEFQKLLMQHPEMAARLPRDPVVVLLLDGHPGFNRWSRAVAKRGADPGDRIIEVRVKRLGPLVSRIQELELDLPSRGRTRRVVRFGA